MSAGERSPRRPVCNYPGRVRRWPVGTWVRDTASGRIAQDRDGRGEGRR